MKEFILLMYNDATNPTIAQNEHLWEAYLSALRRSEQFDGGSAIGTGIAVRKNHLDLPAEAEPNGFLRLRAESLADVRRFLEGNPIYEAGGTVEIRELPADD
jgi:hypothetical protein